VKTATFTVHATAEQSIRWKRAAEAEGHRAAGTWLAAAADAYLRVRARAGLPLPLAWHRGSFMVCLEDGREVRVQGMVSPPFGHFEGTFRGPDRSHGPRTLVHVASHRIIATLKSARQARALAAEIAPVLLRGELPDLLPVVERHVRESV
jgi:hypothetical protein